MKSKTLHSEVEPEAQHQPQARSQERGGMGQARKQISFDRKELNTILATYGYGVSSGQWRDYAIDHLKDAAIFSIFRHSSEMPIYRIEKHPKLARRQGAFCLVAASGQILKRGHELAQVLRPLKRKTLAIVD